MNPEKKQQSFRSPVGRCSVKDKRCIIHTSQEGGRPLDPPDWFEKRKNMETTISVPKKSYGRISVEKDSALSNDSDSDTN